MHFSDKNIIISQESSGEVIWRSPSNIALIKYWGKRKNQVPENPSLSFTLDKSFAETKLNYVFQDKGDIPRIQFSFMEMANQAFASRVETYIISLMPLFPWLKKLDLHIDSQNNFPHSAGIASSAAGLSSLALCLNTIYTNLSGQDIFSRDFFKQSSYLSRLASGSAARSVYGGFTTWGTIDKQQETSDAYASPVPFRVHDNFIDIQDSILIIHSGKKPVSSSEGHALMKKHPYAKARFKQANEHVSEMLDILKSGNWQGFISITEQEALTLHALIMSSDPAYILFKPETIKAIEKIRSFRKQHKLLLCFTIDAGPNLHLLYPGEIKDEVKLFIKDELAEFCQDNQWIDDGIGQGPELLQNKFV